MSSEPHPDHAFISRIPKVELHVHLETSLRLRRLLERQNARGDPPVVAPHLVADPMKFTGYDRLRRVRYLGRAGVIPDSLYTPENLQQVAWELLEEAHRQNVRYLELRVGGRRAFSLLGVRGVVESIYAACREAKEMLGVRCGIILTAVRERGPEEATRLAEEAVSLQEYGVVGFDLAGDEANYPPALFSRASSIAREGGLGVTVHAGEFAGPASIWTAIYHLGATRIGHGLRAAEDPSLVEVLREQRITLELCPTSNLRLGLVSQEAYPLRRFLEAGVPITINSDDPLLLGIDLTRELQFARKAFGLTREEILSLLETAAQAAFLPPEEREQLLGAIRGFTPVRE
ncbi:MAG: adenosine deaminase [Armatimonadota bacterium]|nr:adenosine deaminase [Armatimonadota bacterium]MDR5703485.1 adenosine deaminase [Armatimonadota bacterium]